MPVSQPLPKIKPGDPIRAADMMALRDAIQRQRLIPGGAGVVIEETEQGTLLRPGFTISFWFGVAKGDIPARSGSTLGTGVVTVHYDHDDGTTHTDTSGDFDLEVVNISSNTMGAGEGITDGTMCFVQKDAYGTLLVAPAEC
jgi:hypothetical protein